ncbi:MAG: phenylacetate--CoA ligase family protein [Candidatus Cloacimonetes bacterium]|nr:phenylacetate--CoA ligase family protein [Candidatus Cloacimonadota bacterium]
MSLLFFSDLFSGKTVRKHYRFYSQTQWYDQEQMRGFQKAKLVRLLKHCRQNLPYYANVMKNLGMEPEDIKEPGDIVCFPVLTKELILEHKDEFVPHNLKDIKGVKSGFTGGTTGGAFPKRNDAATRSSSWGAYQRFYDWMGIGRNDEKVDLMGGYAQSKKLLVRLKGQMLDKVHHSHSFDTYETFERNFSRLVQLLQTRDIKLIRAYTQYLHNMAVEMRNRGLKFQLKAIMTTAEPLFEEHRALFREVFACETFDQYGCGEIGSIAFECEHHNGLHVTEERVFLEVGKNKELILTDLDNFAMPLIRYMNGDEAELDEQACTCGRKSPLIKWIKGRTIDYLTGPEGQSLHSSYLWKIIYESGIAPRRNLQKFQALQTSSEHIKFRYVGQKFDADEEALLEKLIREKLGMVTLVFSNESDIENSSSGKYMPVVNQTLQSSFKPEPETDIGKKSEL